MMATHEMVETGQWCGGIGKSCRQNRDECNIMAITASNKQPVATATAQYHGCTQ